MEVLPKSPVQKERLIWIAGVGVIFLVALALILIWEPGTSYVEQEGDIVIQQAEGDPQAFFMSVATGSPANHVGVLVLEEGQWHVLHVADGQAQTTPLDQWQRDGASARINVYRLGPEYAEAIPAFVAAAKGLKGTPEDKLFELGGESLYAAELVYRAFEEATGEPLLAPAPLRELNYSALMPIIEENLGGEDALDRPIVTPLDIAGAAKLERALNSGLLELELDPDALAPEGMSLGSPEAEGETQAQPED